MDLQIIAFGQIAEITGKELIVSAQDTESLKKILVQKFPALSDKKFEIAVNKKMIVENVKLTKNDIVALMPPYSGG